MRKMKRILSFIMACVIFISSANTGVYATEMDESTAMVEEAVESTESLSESTEIVEFTESVGDVKEKTVTTELEEAVKSIENQQELPDVRDYNDLLEMEAVEIDPDEIEGEVYDADELAVLAENMPAMMSTSYNLYWGNYSSYYIYNHLSEDEQKLWDALEVLCASYLEDETDLTNGLTGYVSIDTTETITAEDLMGFANMFKYAHPQYYYLRSGYSYYAGETRVRLAFMVYDAFTDGSDRKNATNAVKAQLDTWCEQIALGSTEEEKVKIIHDIICDNVDYNHGVLAGDNQITSEEEEIYFTQSAYSVFCTDLTVCAGYTQTFMWLCNAFDIECFGVTSPGHAWNKVKVNDNWYNVDVTWDDNDGVGNRDYYCYLKNDAYIHTLSSHDEEEEWLPYLPSCTLDSGSDFYNAGTLPVISQQVAKPVISVVQGDTGYTVTIESATNGAKIFYTLDGKTPSEANSKGNLYTGAFKINQTSTIRAIAVCDGYIDSAVAEGASIDEIEYIVDSGSCGTDVIWELDSKGVLTISGSGDMESYASADAVPWYTYSSDIQSVEIENGVTSVGDYAFSSVANVQVIKLADSITKIGAYAFSNSSLAEIKIPVGVTEIGDYAFYNSDLVEIEIPAGVTEIGMYAFASSYDLAHVKICGNPTTIGERVFENCDKLTEVELSDTYTKIGTMMFFSCDGLVSIELPESLTEIGQQALSYCSKLEEIVIPAKVVMQPYAFYYSTGLKKVTIEDGVTSIPYGAFYLCSALEEIRIPKSVTSIGNIAIDGTTTIYSYAGSAAETYANNNGNTFVDVGTTEYEVRFVTGTEEQIASVICQRESLITEPALSARMGYTFGGWYTSDEIHDESTEWDFANDTVTKEVTLYAYWIPNVYEVTFDAGEGIIDTAKMNVIFDTSYGELPVPIRENYTFLGWYTALEDGALVDTETIVKTAGNHTLYALYEVTIVAQGEYNGTFGTGSWKLDALETMTVSGYAGSWYDIAPEHKEATLKLVLEEGITSIDDSAFMNFVNVTKVVLPESLTEIGSQAFMGCTSLVEINLPNSVATIGEYAFNNCTALQQINLPNGLTEISPYVFAGCRLTSIEIPASVTEIRDSAFFGCSFTSVTVPDTVTEIEEYAFNACKNLETVTLSNNITYIGEGLFAACEKLSEVTIPTGVTSIGAEAFRECSALTEFVLPANVETIGANAFESCVGLTELVIPVNVETIGANAFEGCTGLTEMTIPGNVKTLGEELFYGCRGLTSVIFEEGVETLGARALYDCNNLEYVYLAGSMSYDAPIFNDVYCDVHTKLLSAGPENGDYDVEFGWTEEIPSYAFANLVSLQSCVIPSTVTEIGERAFMSTGLTVIDIPNSVTSIGEGSFIDCSTLTQVYIPKTVTSIGSTAFAETTAIIGFTDSAAYTYAMDNGNEFIDMLNLAIKVEFVTDTDKEIETQYYFEESLVAEPTGLEKTGHTLEGWYTSAEVQDEDTKWDFVNGKVTDDITLYANWIPNIYKVSYELNYEGAEEVEGESVTYGDLYGTLYEPNRTGYTFLGWFTKAESGEQITEELIYTIASDSTIYAHWEANTYAVTFDANGGTVETTELLVTYDSLYGELPVPVKKGFEFFGWFTDKNVGQQIKEDTKVEITAPQTLYAQWKVAESEVTFDAAGGVEIADVKKVIFGMPYGELPVPVREGSVFKYWCLEDGTVVTDETIVSVTENHILYAKWAYKVVTPIARLLDGTNLEGLEAEPETRIYLTTETNGAQIYFTTDAGVNLALSAENGTLAEVATLYEDAIELTESGMLYAIAVKEGYTCSEVMTVSYTVLDDSYNWGDITEEDIEEQGFSTTADVPKELWVAGIAEEASYTGKAITYPELRVYSYTTLLKEKTDYTVKYKNNKNAGTATITIAGKGNYSGSIVKTFEIKPLNLSNAEIPNVTLQYNKKVQKPTTTVKYELNGKTVTLKKGTDFNYIYPGTDKKLEDYDADAFKEVGTYTVYLVGKGNYYTEDDYSVAFEVTIVEEPLISKASLAKIPNQKYTGEEITPSVTIKHGSKKLEEGTDYEIIEYINNVGVGTASIVIEGIGDYVGTRTATFKITGTALSKVRMSGFAKSLPWTGEEVCQDEVTFGYTVGKGEDAYVEYLEEGTHYTVTYQKNTSVGTATVIFEGIEENGYTGTIKKTYKITGISMKNVKVNGLLSTIAYDGGDNTQDGYELVYTEGKGEDAYEISLVEDTEGIGEGDYRVTYKNNGKAGTATITFTGINGYTGTIKKTYKITAYNLADGEGRISVSEIPEQTYLKGGAMPKPEVIYTTTYGEEILLVEGKDYTLKYSNNKIIADETAKKAPMVTITGKGNFKGKQMYKFTIIGSNLSATTMVATDVVYQNKAGICKPSIKVYDVDGKLLKTNTDYQKTIIYQYAADVEVTQKINNIIVYEMRFEGDLVEKDDIIPVGAEITAIVTGIKNYEGTEEVPSTRSATFKYVAADIAKAKVTVATQTYTGKAVEPTKDDITVKVGKVTLEKTDYEIVGYSNNVKKGTAKITIRGIGNYGGEKTVTFKINSKSMNYTIIFDKNAETATGTMKVASISAGKNLTANAYKNKGYKFVGWNTQADGSGYTYTDKEKFYLQGAMWIFGSQITLYAQWEAIE